MKVSNCCGAKFYEPGFRIEGEAPDINGICSACNEYSEAIEQDAPSIIVMDIPASTPEEIIEQKEIIEKKSI